MHNYPTFQHATNPYGTQKTICRFCCLSGKISIISHKNPSPKFVFQTEQGEGMFYGVYVCG